MNREKELLKNTIILMIGRYLPKFFTLITLPIITGALTKTEYGTYDLITTLVSLCLPVVTLQIQSAAFRFLIDYRKDRENASRIISNIFLFTVVMSILAIIVIFTFYNGINLETKTLVCIYFFVDIIYLTMGQIARGLSYNHYYAMNAVIYSALNMILIVLTVYAGEMSLDGVLVSFIGANVIATLYLMVKIKYFSYINFRYFSIRTILELLGYSWPMVPNNLSQWVLKISDRLVITAVLGVEANAVYAVANKIPNLLTDAQGVFSMAWQENASIASKDEDSGKYFSHVFKTFFNLVIGFTYILVAATPILFALLIRGDYAEAYYQMPLLIIGTLFGCLSSFQGGVYVAFKKTKSVGVTTMAAAACNFLIDILLVNQIGITAGSVSTLVSYLLLFLFRMFDVQKFQKISYDYKKIGIGLALLVVMCIFTFQKSIICNVINMVLAVAGAFIYNKSLVKALMNKVVVKFNSRCI